MEQESVIILIAFSPLSHWPFTTTPHPPAWLQADGWMGHMDWSCVAFSAYHCTICIIYIVFTSFQAHLDSCLYESVPCPNRCSAHLLRFNLDDHIEYLCPKRRVVCDFCLQEFPGDYMDQVSSLKATWWWNVLQFLPPHLHPPITFCWGTTIIIMLIITASLFLQGGL